MNYYKIKYQDGTQEILKAKNDKELFKTNDFYTKEHINTSIFQLQGEQLAIAINNDQESDYIDY